MLKTAVLLTEATEFLAFGRGQAVGASALIEIGLFDPVANGLSGGFKLGGEFVGRATTSGQFDDLLAKRRWVGWVCSWHVDLFCFDKWKIVH